MGVGEKRRRSSLRSAPVQGEDEPESCFFRVGEEDDFCTATHVRRAAKGSAVVFIVKAKAMCLNGWPHAVLAMFEVIVLSSLGQYSNILLSPQSGSHGAPPRGKTCPQPGEPWRAWMDERRGQFATCNFQFPNCNLQLTTWPAT